MKGHALIHSGKWEGHDSFGKKFLKYPDPPQVCRLFIEKYSNSQHEICKKLFEFIFYTLSFKNNFM